MYGQPVMYGQPQYIAPPPPVYGYGVPPPSGPTVIHINNQDNDGTPCQFCGSKTDHIPRKSVGCVAIAWGCCLLWTTGWLCWLPCVMDGCKDVELVCVKCQNVKQTIPANCL
jgi:hypothetical protein